jgi:curved DNA-binding protein CbpA
MIKNLRLLGPLVHSFRIVPDHFRKIFFRNKLISATSPTPPFRGQKNFPGTINCQYGPIFKRILHDYLYLNNKLRAFGLFDFFISHFRNTYGFSFERTDSIFANFIFSEHRCRNHAIREIFKTHRETWRSARKPGDSRVNRETWQLGHNWQQYSSDLWPLFLKAKRNCIICWQISQIIKNLYTVYQWIRLISLFILIIFWAQKPPNILVWTF